MIKNSTVFLDFTAETASQSSITAYAGDLGSRAVLVETSVPVKADEHLLVTYYSGDTAVFTHEIHGDIFILPNTVILNEGKYEAYFAVYNADGVKLTATAAATVTVIKNRVLNEVETDLAVESLYSQLLGEYDRLLLSVEKIKASLMEITDIVVGKNLFDKSLATKHKLDYATGQCLTSANHILSAFIEAKVGMEFTCTYNFNEARKTIACMYGAFDKNMNYLKEFSVSSAFSYTVADSSVAYIKVCVGKAFSDQFQIERTDISQTEGYEEFTQSTSLKSAIVQSENIASAAIKTNHLSASCVTENKLADGAVSSAKLSSKCILPQHISDSLKALLDFDIDDELSGNIMVSAAARGNGESMTCTFYGKSSQKATPSVDNAAAITDANGISMTVQGKNLLSNAWQSQVINGVTFTVMTDGGIKISGQAEGQEAAFPLISSPLSLPKGKYTMGGIRGGSTDTYYLKISTDVGASGIITDTLVINAEADVSLTSVYLCVADGEAVNEVLYPQLEYGEKATAFSKPVAAQNLTCSGTFCGIEVTEFDEYTVESQGKYYYCDSLDSNRQVRRICSLVLDGETVGARVMEVETDTSNRTVAKISLTAAAKKFPLSEGVITSHFKAGRQDTDVCYISNDGNYLCLVHGDESINSVEAWNEWLSQNNVDVRYALANSTAVMKGLSGTVTAIYPYMTVLCPKGIGHISYKADIKRYVDSAIMGVLGGSY